MYTLAQRRRNNQVGLSFPSFLHLMTLTFALMLAVGSCVLFSVPLVLCPSPTTTGLNLGPRFSPSSAIFGLLLTVETLAATQVARLQRLTAENLDISAVDIAAWQRA
jgi:hypothetical protein